MRRSVSSASAERALLGLDEIEAAVGVARIIRLAHPADEVGDAPREADARGDGEEERVAAGDERRGEVGRALVRAAHVLVVLGEGAAREEPGEVEHGERNAGEVRDPLRLFQLDGVLLPVAKAERFDAVEAAEVGMLRPEEAGRGVLPAGEEDERGGISHAHRG